MRKTLTGLVTAGLVALIPCSAAAASTPSPPSSDALKADLADAPSSDYIAADPGTAGVLVGTFDAAAYSQLQSSDPAKQTEIVDALTSDGWVTGYGRAWISRAAAKGLAEIILVFADSHGANAAYGASRVGDVSNPLYASSFDTSPIPNSYGVQDHYSSGFGTGILWVKGNDVFAVVFVSANGYLASDALLQAEKENALAPNYTIQPEPATAATGTSAAYRIGQVLAIVVVAALVIGVIGLVVGLIVRNNRRSSMSPAPLAVPLAVQMSPDGRYWWDGSAWQDALAIAPAHAQRSPDGAYWWDGTTWRLVPPSQ